MIHFNIVMCRSVCDYRRSMDWILDLLSTYTHDSELEAITASSLISTIHKSPPHPLSLSQPAVSLPVVPWQRLLTVEILQLQALRPSLQTPLQNSTDNLQLTNSQTGGFTPTS
jgi:hypothetical protein